jgi:hypothetical protein
MYNQVMNRIVITCTAALLLAIIASALIAGPINPPGGPVGPSGVSLTDLASQINGISGQGANGSAIPGNSFAGPGTMSVTIGTTVTTVPVYALQQTLSGGPTLEAAPAAQQLNPSTLLVVTDISSPLATLAGAVKSAAHLQAFSVTMPRSGSGSWTITGLGNIYLRSIAFSAITKANGQIAQVAVVEVLAQPIILSTGALQAQALQYSIDGATITTKVQVP